MLRGSLLSVPLVFRMDIHISECTVSFHAAGDIIISKGPGNPFRNSFHVRNSYHTPGFIAIRIGKGSDQYKCWIKEAIAIRKQGTTMNRDEGQYQLSHVFDNLLKKSSGNLVAKQQSTSAVHRRWSLHH